MLSWEKKLNAIDTTQEMFPTCFACGKDNPVGLQLVGPHFAESRLLAVSHQYQLLTDWHRRVPDGYA